MEIFMMDNGAKITLMARENIFQYKQEGLTKANGKMGFNMAKELSIMKTGQNTLEIFPMV